MALERAALAPVVSPEERATLLLRLDEIEKSVITGKIPAAFADQTYVLREHIAFARARLSGADKLG